MALTKVKLTGFLSFIPIIFQKLGSYLASHIKDTEAIFIVIMRRPCQESLQLASWARWQWINIPLSSRAAPQAMFQVAIRKETHWTIWSVRQSSITPSGVSDVAVLPVILRNYQEMQRTDKVLTHSFTG